MNDIERTERIRKHLSRYVQMLIRCYDPKCKSYKNYGGNGVTVCEEWLNSPDAFILWCEENGYKEGLVLDKDILSDKLGLSNKQYSPDTCQFITPEENMQYMLDNTLYQAVASYDKEGNLVGEYKSIASAGKHDGSAPNIGRAIRGERLTCKDMFWRYIDKVGSAPKSISVPAKKPLGKRIAEIDEKGNIIAEYDNAVLASEATGILRISINSVTTGHRKSVFGRRFVKL